MIALAVAVACGPDLDADGAHGRRDCDDEEPLVNPKAVEVCGDSIDQDCSGDDAACWDEVWSTHVGTEASPSSLALGDLGNDGSYEVIVGLGASAESVLVLDAGTGDPLASLSGGPGEEAGRSLGVDDQGQLWVGAPAADGARGRLFLDVPPTDGALERARVVLDGDVPFGWFGSAVYVHGSDAWVSAPYAAGDAGPEVGLLYRFADVTGDRAAADADLVVAGAFSGDHLGLGVIALDVDADGVDEIVAGGESVSVFEHDRVGRAERVDALTSWTGPAEHMDRCDVDDDGLDDLVFISRYGPFAILVPFGPDDGTVPVGRAPCAAAHVVERLREQADVVAAADVDGDGKFDVAYLDRGVLFLALGTDTW